MNHSEERVEAGKNFTFYGIASKSIFARSVRTDFPDDYRESGEYLFCRMRCGCIGSDDLRHRIFAENSKDSGERCEIKNSGRRRVHEKRVGTVSSYSVLYSEMCVL